VIALYEDARRGMYPRDSLQFPQLESFWLV
jgi:hypothetical protein